MTDREIEAICENYNYFDNINQEEEKNEKPITQEEFALLICQKFIDDNVESYERKLIHKKADQIYDENPTVAIEAIKKTMQKEILIEINKTKEQNESN